MGRSEAFGIHWFRRDLRIAANPALEWSWKRHGGRVVGLFIFDRAFLSRPDFSVPRFQFFLLTLKALSEELRLSGSDLLVLDTGPKAAFEELLPRLHPATVSFNRDYEPFARKRDQEIEKLLRDRGVEVHSERDHLMVEPPEILKESGEPYQVYSPFARAWMAVMQRSDVSERSGKTRRGLSYLESEPRPIFSLTWSALGEERTPVLEEEIRKNGANVTIPLPPAGSRAAYALAKVFERKIDGYKESRDFPAEEGTSKLSVYLKNGSITVPMLIELYGLQKSTLKDGSSRGKFLSELIWREFYYSILYHYPRVETTPFQEKFSSIRWENDEGKFAAWREGRTGYPLVDAGMRELAKTGWMHNRIRMVVASFLTKDLLINWQWGERHFMNLLLDGDLAPNNGGWQWASSTGCDPQPYFRIFNPYLQSKKFDPDGAYIRTHVSELSKLTGREIHEPDDESRGDYPPPIVDHWIERGRAIKKYEEASAQRSTTP